MKDELISVVIIVYNTSNFLGECIESVINQTYKKLDIVIVNDGSTDNSSEIVNKYLEKDSRINFIDRKINMGTMYTRQEGYKNSKGKYISFVDSDDFLKKDAIEKMYNDLLNESVDFVKSNFVKYKNGIFFDNKNVIKENYKICKENFEPKIYDILFKTIYLNSMCGNLIKKEKLSCILDINKDAIYAEDILCNYYMFKSIESMFIESNELYVYRVNESSITNVIDEERIRKKLIDATCCYSNMYDNLATLNLKNESYYKEIIVEKLLNVFCFSMISIANFSNKKEFYAFFDKILSEINTNGLFYNYKYKNILKNNCLYKICNNCILKNKKRTFYMTSKLAGFIKKIKEKIKGR